MRAVSFLAPLVVAVAAETTIFQTLTSTTTHTSTITQCHPAVTNCPGSTTAAASASSASPSSPASVGHTTAWAPHSSPVWTQGSNATSSTVLVASSGGVPTRTPGAPTGVATSSVPTAGAARGSVALTGVAAVLLALAAF